MFRHTLIMGWAALSLLGAPKCGTPKLQADETVAAQDRAYPAPRSSATWELPSELADAAERGDSTRCQQLLTQGADVRVAQADGTTALHWAAYRGDYDLVLQLFVWSSGSDPNARNRYGVTPLMLASQNGDGRIVQFLLEVGAEVDHRLPTGETALMVAARTGKLAAVTALLEAGAEVNATEQAGQTALMWAAAEGHRDVAERLIERGADVDRTLTSGFNPLFFAVREGRRDVVAMLLEKGVDVNQAMQVERSFNKSAKTGISPLVLAIENGHFDLAVDLLEAGADPNDQRSGFSPLHTLTWVRKPNRGDGTDGDPAPRGSGRRTSLQCVDELIAHGAEVNLQLERGSGGRGRLHRRGATPFLLAAKTNDLPYLNRLLERGADPHLPNIDRSTPLMAAAGLGTLAPGEEAGTEEEAVACVKLLLSLGADVNAVDRNGETAMHGAAYKSLPQVVRLLAEHGADPEIWNRENKYGWTPLKIAQGYRPGNFKPAPETIRAIEAVLP